MLSRWKLADAETQAMYRAAYRELRRRHSCPGRGELEFSVQSSQPDESWPGRHLALAESSRGLRDDVLKPQVVSSRPT